MRHFGFRWLAGLPASNSGRVDGVCRFGLAGLSVAPAGKLSVSLDSGPRLPRGIIAYAMARRDGRERSTMEGAGRRSKASRVPAVGQAVNPVSNGNRQEWQAKRPQ